MIILNYVVLIFQNVLWYPTQDWKQLSVNVSPLSLLFDIEKVYLHLDKKKSYGREVARTPTKHLGWRILQQHLTALSR